MTSVSMRMECSDVAAAAQDDGVAGLEAEAGSIDRDVGAGLIDDRDHAEGNPDLLDLHAVGQPPALDDLADGIRQGGDAPQAPGHVADAVLVEHQPVHQRLGKMGGLALLDVVAVLAQDLGACGVPAPWRSRCSARFLSAAGSAASSREACLALTQMSLIFICSPVRSWRCLSDSLLSGPASPPARNNPGG